VKGLYVAKSFDEWRAVPKFGEYGDCRYLESWIIPQSWAGGVKPDNTKTALSVLADKVNYKIDRIDLSARSGAMTDGKSDIDKIEAIMQNANEWQEEINQKLNYGHSM
jgi:phosphoribosylanthranilate isomerase